MQLKAEEEAENISNLEHEPNKDKLRHWKVYKPRARKNEKPREKKTVKKTRGKEVEKREWKGVVGRGRSTYHSRAANNWWPWVMLQRCKLMWHPLEPELQPIDLALAPADELCKERGREKERESEKDEEKKEVESWVSQHYYLEWFHHDVCFAAKLTLPTLLPFALACCQWQLSSTAEKLTHPFAANAPTPHAKTG